MKRRHLFSYFFIIAMLSTSCMQRNNNPEGGKTTFSAYFENIPFEMNAFPRPEFPEREVSILSYGAVGDGISINTEAINNAIREVSQSGGGRVVIPAGIWLTGSIELLDNVNLHTMQNALIIFSPDITLYPIVDTSFEGLNTRRATSPVFARNARNIAITGDGVFDGSGDSWRFVKKGKMTDSQWRALVESGGVLNEKRDTWYPSEQSLKGHVVSDSFNNPQNLTTDAEWEEIHHWLRPVMISLIDCKDILFEGVTFRNSPAWCVHPLMCENFTMSEVKVFNPWYSQNGDGLDLESCKNALIADCLFDVGDDAICLKSGKDEDGRKRNVPCENVIIRNNVVLHGHGGFVIGSEMSGGVKNIYVADCLFHGTDVGLRFKSTRGRGGVVEKIWIENIIMADIPTEPLLFDLFYSGRSAVEELEEGKSISYTIPEVDETTPSFRDISIRNIRCKGARRAMYFNGLPEMKIRNIQVEDVIISSHLGAEIVEAENITFNNVHIYPETGEPFTFHRASHITVDGRNVKE